MRAIGHHRFVLTLPARALAVVEIR